MRDYSWLSWVQQGLQQQDDNISEPFKNQEFYDLNWFVSH